MDIITLLKDFVSGLLQAEENFLGDLNTFPELEQTASELSRRMAADFIGLVGFLTPISRESLVRLIFLCQINFYVLRTIVLYAILYL